MIVLDHTIIDPFIFCLPDNELSECERFCRDLAHWGSRVLEDPHGHSTPESCVTRLIECDRYPTLEKLKYLVRQYPSLGFSAPDLSNLLRSLADRRPYTEQLTGIRDVVVSSNTGINPERVVERLPTEVGTAFRKTLYGAALGWPSAESGDSKGIATTGIDESYVAVEGVVALYERVDGEVQEDVTVFAQFSVVLASDDAEEGVDWCSKYQDPVNAVETAYRTLLSESDRRALAMGTTTAGPGFVESLERLGIHRKASILRRVFFLAANAACGRLAAMNGADLHWVRKSISADAPQVDRADGGKLWRCKVTQKGAGYRLQYWAFDSGEIELERVVRESEI